MSNLFSYCTLREAKYQLQIPLEDTYHDEHLLQLMYAASSMVKNHLKSFSAYRPALNEDDEPAEKDSNYEPLLQSFGSEDDKSERVRPEIKQAVLILISELFKNREGDTAFSGNTVPPVVQAILNPLRDPAYG